MTTLKVSFLPLSLKSHVKSGLTQQLEEIVKFALIRKMKIFSIDTMRDFARMIGDNAIMR